MSSTISTTKVLYASKPRFVAGLHLKEREKWGEILISHQLTLIQTVFDEKSANWSCKQRTAIKSATHMLRIIKEIESV